MNNKKQGVGGGNTIYWDMDGVLADFAGAVFEAHNVGNPQGDDLAQWYDYPTNCGWKIEPALKELGVEVESWYDPEKMNTGWWANLAPHTEMLKLVNFFKGFAGLMSPRVLTCIGAGDYAARSAAGKALWLKKHLPYTRTIMVSSSKDKALLAREGNVLVDDKEETIDAWNAAGGTGVLVPRPWNSRWSKVLGPEQSVDYVRSFLEGFLSVVDEKSFVPNKPLAHEWSDIEWNIPRNKGEK